MSFDLPPYVGSPVVQVSDAITPEMRELCSYCRYDRPAEKLASGGWWHHVARGGDRGQYEPCGASSLR